MDNHWDLVSGRKAPYCLDASQRCDLFWCPRSVLKILMKYLCKKLMHNKLQAQHQNRSHHREYDPVTGNTMPQRIREMHYAAEWTF
eukprot:1159134-Pelagomonas_calceolata.AAC.8